MELGPSDISTPCDRRLGYRLVEIPGVNNDVDPWAAIIGTAMHSWLEVAISLWCSQEHQGPPCDWITEHALSFGQDIRGRSDLYSRHRKMVIDHKGVGTDVLRKILKHGPPPQYVTQGLMYGLGYENEGFPVESIALIFYPRAGRLKDIYVWVADYDRGAAQRALDRPSKLAADLLTLDVISNPHRWEQVAAFPSDDCGFCPWYDPGRLAELGATDTGCPGH